MTRGTFRMFSGTSRGLVWPVSITTLSGLWGEEKGKGTETKVAVRGFVVDSNSDALSGVHGKGEKGHPEGTLRSAYNGRRSERDKIGGEREQGSRTLLRTAVEAGIHAPRNKKREGGRSLNRTEESQSRQRPVYQRK